MSSVQLGIDLIATFLTTAWLLFHYGNWYRHHIFVTLAVLVAWYFSFIIVLVLPIDISTTTYLQCLSSVNATTTTINSTIANATDLIPACTPPPSYVGSDVLTNLWRVVYWTSQCLTWLLLPLTLSYINSGEFTIKKKLQAALLDNAIYYSLYLFICVVLLIYLATRPELKLDFQKLKAIASSASNSWGLFLLVGMLGYGLISVPLSIYSQSHLASTLSASYFRTAKLSQERNSAEETLDDTLESLQLVQNTPNSQKFRSYLNQIDTLIPVEFRERIQRRRARVESSSVGTVDEKMLVKLHKEIKKALQNYHRVETQWEGQLDYVIYLEDVDKCGRSGGRVFLHSFEQGHGRGWNCWRWWPKAEYYYRCILTPYLMKGIAVLAGALSLIIIWSEATFFNRSPVLSVFAAFLNSAKYNYAWIEVVSTLTTAYLAVCAFYTVFKIRVFNFYYLAGRHQTDEYSLVFSGMLLSRLTPPLCLNVISLFHLDSHIIKSHSAETSYTKVMGHMDVLSLISDGFNIYFPIGILIVSLLTWFKVGKRLLSLVGIEQFFEEHMGDDEVGGVEATIDLVREGKELIGREKRRRLRSQETQQTNRTWRYDTDRARNRNIPDNNQTQQPPRGTSSNSNSAGGGNCNNPPRDLFDDV